YVDCCAKKYKKQNIIEIKEEEINEYLMLTIIEKAGSAVPIVIPQKPIKPILFPQLPSVPISIPQKPIKPILIPQPSVPISIPQKLIKPILIPQPSVPILIPPEESNDINDKNIFNSIKEEITDSIKTNNEIKDLIDNSILKQNNKNELYNLRKQKLYEKI
ncbi:9260_t:CDS:1, partial [Racocetra persica]